MNNCSKLYKEVYVGNDIKNSLYNLEYSVYESQKYLIENAYKSESPLLLTINRIPCALVKIKAYKMIEFKHKLFLDYKYKWYPQKKSIGKNWNVYFTYELLETYKMT